MGTVFSYFSQQPPPRVPTDTIVPLNIWDSNPLSIGYILEVTLRFDTHLNLEKLRTSVNDLTRQDGWNKVTARLRRNSEGKLEYHIPDRYDSKRAQVGFTHLYFNSPAEKHPLASKLPKPSSRPAIKGDVTEFKPLTHSESTPSKLEDYLYKDIPVLHIHICSFDDTTLITTTWPHCLWDAIGCAEFLHAWSQILRGEKPLIKRVIGFHEDSLASIGMNPSTYRHTSVTKVLSGWREIVFGLRTILECLWSPPAPPRTLFVPGNYLRRLRQDAIDQLAPKHGSKIFISDGDVLVAWTAKLAMEGANISSESPILLLSTLSIRKAFENDVLPASHAYLGNAVSPLLVHATAGEILNKPLSHTAYLVRRAIEEQGSQENIENIYHASRKSMDRSQRPLTFGVSHKQILVVYSNWNKGKYFELDFGSAAYECTGRDSKPSYVQQMSYSTSILRLNKVIRIMGEDSAGNYWLDADLNAGFWPAIESRIAQLGLEMKLG